LNLCTSCKPPSVERFIGREDIFPARRHSRYGIGRQRVAARRAEDGTHAVEMLVLRSISDGRSVPSAGLLASVGPSGAVIEGTLGTLIVRSPTRAQPMMQCPPYWPGGTTWLPIRDLEILEILEDQDVRAG
jgi:hypothetical protein